MTDRRFVVASFVGLAALARALESAVATAETKPAASAPATSKMTWDKVVQDAINGKEFDPLTQCLPAGFPRVLAELASYSGFSGGNSRCASVPELSKMMRPSMVQMPLHAQGFATAD